MSDGDNQIATAFARAKKALGERADRIRSELRSSDAFANARAAADGAATVARVVLGNIARAADEAPDADKLVDRYVNALSIVAPQMDAKADALGVGRIGEAGAGVANLDGMELLYVRGRRPQIRVSQLFGKAARLALGASAGAYVACLYGDPIALSHATTRRGADIDIVLASIGFFRATSAIGQSKASGWMVGLSAGVDVGVPLLGELSAFQFEERIIGRADLTGRHVERIEAALAVAPDRSVRRRIAKAL